MHKNTHQDTFTLLPKDMNFKGEIYHTHRKCYCCLDEYTIYIVKEDYIKWQQGHFIQNAFPYLDSSQREMLQTGYHPDCYDMMFGQED